MKTNRRQFIQRASLGLAAAGLFRGEIRAAESAALPVLAKPSPMRLGLVTYELAKDWSIETIIKNCEAAQFEGVELRTTHGHGVELSLPKAQREAVRKRFADSKVQLMGLGSTYDFHSPDPAKLRRDIDSCKEYILLAKDVGASGVKVRPNALPKEVPKEKTLEQIGKALRELGEFGAPQGVAIRLEVHGAETAELPHIKRILDVADHPNVGACWNSNDSDLAGAGFEANFALVKNKIIAVHMRDLFLDRYPFRQLLNALIAAGYRGYCLAEIPQSADPVRVMKYYRALWLAYQNLL